ncbi:hypothetical protein CERSUDRAFT_99223 [Gelatoporia subvermispora B]|uniref:Uncharacterized protein n=1 Tax=Ceriporiopsis subvermispora (strain B) TaxID=914234 RepID=M2Q7P7_CERS8|nr:hypothetical protein CERSUDRAFT_99223 [Gelatoporia subvermispora B]
MAIPLNNPAADNSPIYWWGELCTALGDDCHLLTRYFENVDDLHYDGERLIGCVVMFDGVEVGSALGVTSLQALQGASLEAYEALLD